MSVPKGAQDKLYTYHWPGNVREPKNVVERAAVLCNSAGIGRRSILFSHEMGRPESMGLSFGKMMKISHPALLKKMENYQVKTGKQVSRLPVVIKVARHHLFF